MKHLVSITAGAVLSIWTSAPAQQPFDLRPQFSELSTIAGTPSAPFGHGLAVGDFDGDGDSDILTGPWGGALRVFLNDGDGAVTELVGAAPTAQVFTNDLVAGDVDGDGYDDVVMVNFQRPMQLYLNNGDASFRDGSSALGATTGYSAAALGDFDGDGDNDLMLAGDTTELPKIMVNRGGQFTTTLITLPPIGDLVRAIRAADLDDDGDLDAILGTNGTDVLLINDGRGVMADRSAWFPAGVRPTADLQLGDVDGDGDLDAVLVQDFVSPVGRVMLNDGSAAFADLGTASVAPAPVSIMSAALGDVDEDGDLDLAVGTWSDAPMLLYLNDGGGQFTLDSGRTPAGHIDATTNSAFADLDGDGDLELVLGNQITGTTQNRSRIYTNLHRQAHALSGPRTGEVYEIDLFSEPGYGASAALVVPLISASEARVPLGAIGVLRVDPASAAALGLVFVPAPRGQGAVAFAIPSNPRLVGTELFAQFLFVTGAGQARLSNLVEGVIARGM